MQIETKIVQKLCTYLEEKLANTIIEQYTNVVKLCIRVKVKKQNPI